MKKIVKNQKAGFLYLGIVLVSVISLGFFMQSCENKVKTHLPVEAEIEEEVVNSPELEEFIVADIELQQAFNTLTQEIKNINFLEIKEIQNAEGEIVLDVSISIYIENNVRVFNEKKEALIEKFPQLTSSSELRQKCFQQALENSPTINKKILESGINAYQPRLKGGRTEFFSRENYTGYLANQVARSNYVEVIVLVFENGKSIAYIDDKATADRSSITLYRYGSTNYWYSAYSSSRVVKIIHTHTSGIQPSQHDKNEKKKYPGLKHYIFYNGVTKEY